MSLAIANVLNGAPFFAVPRVELKSKEAADEAVLLLQAIKRYAAEAVPGVLTFRIVRFDNIVTIFEEYETLEARKTIDESDSFKKLMETLPRLVVKPPLTEYFIEEK